MAKASAARAQEATPRTLEVVDGELTAARRELETASEALDKLRDEREAALLREDVGEVVAFDGKFALAEARIDVAAVRIKRLEGELAEAEREDASARRERNLVRMREAAAEHRGLVEGEYRPRAAALAETLARLAKLESEIAQHSVDLPPFTTPVDVNEWRNNGTGVMLRSLAKVVVLPAVDRTGGDFWPAKPTVWRPAITDVYARQQ